MKQINKRDWMGLDNAAKIFPSTSTKEDPKVFRFACELKEKINPEVLANATKRTVERFPVFRSILKRGVFWYYLEITNLEPRVKEEHKPPCSAIYNRNKKSLLFRVTYYHSRINLEVYHALTDGSGALQFLRVLVYEYLKEAHAKELSKIEEIDFDASSFQKISDSFQKYYDPSLKKQKFHFEKAYQIEGPKYVESRIKVIEGIIPLSKIKEISKQHGVTITVLLAAVFMKSIEQEMPERKKHDPVVLTIPVNLRNFFESKSIRNFFSIIEVGYDFYKESGTLENIIEELNKDIKLELTEESMRERMTSLSSLEHNIIARAVPLFIKDLIMKSAVKVTDNNSTASLSNVGRVDMPEKLSPYIELFDVFISTNKTQICLCSYNDTVTVTFSSVYKNTDVQKNFFRLLSNLGVEVEIRNNLVDGE